MRVLIGTALAAVVIALGLSPAPALAAGPGQIDGTVLDQDGTPILTCVTAYDAAGYTYQGQGCTDATGAYTINNLVDGKDYRLEATGDATHVDGWYSGALIFDDATNVTPPATAPIVLARANALTGTLTDANGQALDGLDVTAMDLTRTYVNSAQTQPDGTWSIKLPPGDYKVRFSDNSSGATMWFTSARTFDTADTITVTEGATTTVDAQFIPQAKVTGTITDAETGTALSGVCVGLANPATWTPDQSWSPTCTDTDGHYRLFATAPGVYAVFLTDPSGRYAGTFIGGTRDLAAATKFTIGDTGEVVADGQMSVGTVITGTALDSRTHKPLTGVSASLYSGPAGTGTTNSLVWGSVSTQSDANGVYTITGVPSGSFTLLLTPPWQSGYAQQWYQGATMQNKATPVVVTAPVAQRLKPTSFVPGGTVSGTVRDETGAPVAGAIVALDGSISYRVGGCEGQVCAQTDNNGHYVMTAPEGTYRPMAADIYSDTLAPAFYGGASTAASKLSVKALKSYTADFVLRPGGHLTGSIKTASGQTPDPSLYVLGDIFTTDGRLVGIFGADTAFDWTLRSSPLAPGTYILRATVLQPDGEGPTMTAWYDGATTRAAATPITLASQQTKEITFHLP